MSDNTTKIGIIGGGIVGSAVKNFFKEAKVYDKFKQLDSFDEVVKARFIFICVPTPFKNGLDLSIVDEVISEVTKKMPDRENQLIVLKSTALPGTTQNYQDQYPEYNFAFNPEFLRDKSANEDFIKNDRQIVGFTDKTRDSELVRELLEILPKAPYSKLVPSGVAEAVKYAGNTYLALKVIFANQIYDVCQALDVDYDLVKEAVISDKRIGDSHWDVLHTENSLGDKTKDAYRGYGGKCFPKDINSLIVHGNKNGVDVSLFEAGREINLDLNDGQFDD